MPKRFPLPVTLALFVALGPAALGHEPGDDGAR